MDWNGPQCSAAGGYVPEGDSITFATEMVGNKLNSARATAGGDSLCLKVTGGMQGKTVFSSEMSIHQAYRPMMAFKVQKAQPKAPLVNPLVKEEEAQSAANDVAQLEEEVKKMAPGPEFEEAQAVLADKKIIAAAKKQEAVRASVQWDDATSPDPPSVSPAQEKSDEAIQQWINEKKLEQESKVQTKVIEEKKVLDPEADETQMSRSEKDKVATEVKEEVKTDTALKMREVGMEITQKNSERNEKSDVSGAALSASSQESKEKTSESDGKTREVSSKRAGVQAEKSGQALIAARGLEAAAKKIYVNGLHRPVMDYIKVMPPLRAITDAPTAAPSLRSELGQSSEDKRGQLTASSVFELSRPQGGQTQPRNMDEPEVVSLSANDVDIGISTTKQQRLRDVTSQL